MFSLQKEGALSRTRSVVYLEWLALAAFLALLAGLWCFARYSSLQTKTPVAHAQALAGDLVGYAWAGPDIGWISMSCQNQGVCATSNYGVTVGTTGNMDGYAWAGTDYGWVSFNPADLNVADCPEATHLCAAKIDPASGAMTGWARACAAFSAGGVCTGALDPKTGAPPWDGWIHLNPPTATGGNAPVQNSDCTITGWSWGSDNIGWIHWGDSTLGYGVRNTATGCNQVIASISASPSVFPTASQPSAPYTTALTWSSVGATSCVVGSNDFILSGKATSGTVNATLSSTTIYHVSCSGPSGAASQSVLVSVNVPYAALTITAAPVSVQKGGKTVINWSGVNVVAGSCAVRDPSGNLLGTGSTGSAQTGAINGSTTFTYACTSSTDGSTVKATVTVGVVPIVQEV